MQGTKNVQLSMDAILAKVKEDGKVIAYSFDSGYEYAIYDTFKGSNGYLLSVSYPIGDNIRLEFSSETLSKYNLSGANPSLENLNELAMDPDHIDTDISNFRGLLVRATSKSQDTKVNTLIGKFNIMKNMVYDSIMLSKPLSNNYTTENTSTLINFDKSLTSNDLNVIKAIEGVVCDIRRVIYDRYGLLVKISIPAMGQSRLAGGLDLADEVVRRDFCNSIYDSLMGLKSRLTSNDIWVDSNIISVSKLSLDKIHAINLIKLVNKGTDNIGMFTGISDMATIEAVVSIPKNRGHSLVLVKRLIGITSIDNGAGYEFTYVPGGENNKFGLINKQYVYDLASNIDIGSYKADISIMKLLGICIPSNYDFRESFKAKYIM